MNQIDVHYIQVKVFKLSGDGQTVTLPQVLKEVTYVFPDSEQFKFFMDGFEFFFLEKLKRTEQEYEKVKQ